MAKARPALQAFNRGEISPLALARTDVDRLRLSAEQQVNWLPRTLGPMMIRPGTAWVGEAKGDAPTRLVPFVFSASDTAFIELTPLNMRVWVNDSIITRVTDASVFTDFNGASAGTDWTLATSGGATASLAGGVLTLTGVAAGGLATATQPLHVVTRFVEHTFRIVVSKGPVTFRCGSAAGLDDVIPATSLGQGVHSIAIPAPCLAHIYAQFETADVASRIVSSITLEATGPFELPTQWATADLPLLRFTQSADVIFVACPGKKTQRIERRAVRSWSVVDFLSDDGPFPAFAGDSTITITPSGTAGDITLTASRPCFQNGHVGALFRLFHTGQQVAASLGALNATSTAIRVSGVAAAADRNFTIQISGTWVGTIELQRSFDGPTTGFSTYQSFTANTGPTVVNDGLNNIIAWYRWKVTAYTSGSATVALLYAGGGGAGIARVTGFTSSLLVSAEVLLPFSNNTAAIEWRESQWSDVQGWPTAVALHEGRLWLAGDDRIWGSVSDAFDSFDIDKVGDAGPINRSIGEGPIANINWLLPLTRLVIGADTSEIAARSSSFEEPLTPTNFTMKACSTQGSAAIPAVKVDTRGLFVQQSGKRLYELGFDVQSGDYKARDLTRLNPEIAGPFGGFKRIAVQRQPDTRIHCVRGDGTVAVLLYDLADEVEAWWRIQTQGFIEDVMVLPGLTEDRVYYLVLRNGKRYIERCARMDECQGAALNKVADCHIAYSGPGIFSIIGINHLEGQEVVIWGAGPDLVGKVFDRQTVVAGTVYFYRSGLATPVNSAVIGLPYTATYQSSKLAYAAEGGSAIGLPKKVDHLGVVLSYTHNKALQYGPTLQRLDYMPGYDYEQTLSDDQLWIEYDRRSFEFEGEWDTDARLYLVAQAPYPCTVVGAVIGMETNG